jgi:flavin reductase (DIM6/NTAB) family NADH-FMN oxidoreductase RutF
MPLDFNPPKVAVVIDAATHTRALVDGSGVLALQVPCAAQADLTTTVGHTSGRRLAEAGTDKFTAHGIAHFAPELPEAPTDGLADRDALAALPLVAGCTAWLVCRVIPWPAVATAHDLFLAEVVAAWADERVFRDGRWQFDGAPDALRSLHHLGGGHYLLPGAAITGQVLPGA